MTRRRNPRPDPVGRQPRLRLREPVDVLATIPYLIGYHPALSLVVLGMCGNQLTFTARYDLPPADASRQDVRGLIEHMVQVVLRQQVTGVLLVGYGPEERVRPIIMALQRAYDRAGLDVLEMLRADEGRYWSYRCTDPECCPPAGSAYESAASAVAAAWTVAGRVALPDRAAYERQLTPIGGVARIAMRQATAKADDRLIELLAEPVEEGQAAATMIGALDRALDGALQRVRAGEPLTDDEAAWLTVLVASDNLRDLTWHRVRSAREDLVAHRTLWMDVLRRAEPDLTAGPGCLFALAAWRCGEGALARLAMERVLRHEPEDRLAQLLHHVLLHGLPPTALDDLPVPRVKRRPVRRRRKRSSSRRARTRRE